MYYRNYEDYIRSVLGYPMNNQNTYETNYIEENNNRNYNNEYVQRLESLYPEFYKNINPSIIEICSKYSNITKEILEEMVDSIYKKIESKDTRQIRPNNNNQLLRDIIKILILNRLINNKPPKPNPPPMPPYPGVTRPPMPPRPGGFDNYLKF